MTALADELREMIATEGPISVERYMALCLQHPRHGYYTTRESIGRAGDFITAPEVDQMFGELIGLWVAQVWMAMGAPPVLRFVELGPGRGTLMADALRATRIVPGFLDAARVDLVETSPKLQSAQREKLQGAANHMAWYRAIEDLPDGPAIVIANEFFDALPVRHYVRGAGGWHERLVGLAADGALQFGATSEPIAIGVQALQGGPAGEVLEIGRVLEIGQVLEIGHAALRAMELLAARISESGGAILVCDYGHIAPGLGETLQALRGHAYADVLATPGEADLTAHVDFAALARAARQAGAMTHGPVAQGAFLERLGIVERAGVLKAGADARQSASIDAALARFTAPGSTMATLFKVMAVTPQNTPAPPGFEETR